MMTGRIATQIGYPLAGTLLLIAFWAFLCVYGKVPTVVLPTPDKVLHAFIARFDLIVSEGWVTLKETLYGFVLALVIGIPMAVAVANSRALNLMFYPLLIGLQSVPKVALAPIVPPPAPAIFPVTFGRPVKAPRLRSRWRSSAR